MEKTWKLTLGSISAIVAGALEVIGSVTVLIVPPAPLGSPSLATIGAVLITIAGIIAIVGGICAFSRMMWGLALAGSICALPAGLILGVLAIIFIVLGKREFSKVQIRWMGHPSTKQVYPNPIIPLASFLIDIIYTCYNPIRRLLTWRVECPERLG
jgi:hypothetical protein